MQTAVERLDEPAQLRALAGECATLVSLTSPRLPFATVEWLLGWWQHFHERRPLVRDRFFVHVLRDERGTLVGLAPLMLTERPAVGPLRVRSITFFGADRNITELRGLICAPQHEADVTRALLAHLGQHCQAWDWFTWDGVRQASEAHRALSGARDFTWFRETSDHVLVLPTSWQEFRSTRSRNLKEALRKCYNSLGREQHSFDFRVVSQAAELPAALERFFALHALRARASTLTDHADYFTAEPPRALLRSFAHAPEHAPGLRIFELRIGGQVVASRLGFLLNDELYLYFSGFDPAWARYSVMTTTVAEAIKWAIERRLRIVNLSAGTDVSKTRWGPGVVTTCTGVLLSSNAGARLKWDLAASLHRRSRELGWLSRLLQGARRRT